MISFAALDSKQTVCAVSDGVREYEVLDNNKLAFTMFRSVPYLGKPDLNDRPSRASGVHKVQMGHALLGTEVETTIYVSDLENNYYDMHAYSKEVLNKLISYQAGEIYDNTDYFVISKNGSYPREYSMLEVEGAIMSSLKLAELDDNLILRVYNPYRNKDISFTISHKEIKYLKADELSKDDAKNIIKPCGIKTLKLIWG